MAWYQEFPGSGAAEMVGAILRRALTATWASDYQAAVKTLQAWDQHVDLGGMPTQVYDSLKEWIEAAVRALRTGDGALAQSYLHRALQSIGAPLADPDRG